MRVRSIKSITFEITNNYKQENNRHKHPKKLQLETSFHHTSK